MLVSHAFKFGHLWSTNLDDGKGEVRVVLCHYVVDEGKESAGPLYSICQVYVPRFGNGNLTHDKQLVQMFHRTRAANVKVHGERWWILFQVAA